jgi:hypothetical protein
MYDPFSQAPFEGFSGRNDARPFGWVHSSHNRGSDDDQIVIRRESRPPPENPDRSTIIEQNNEYAEAMRLQKEAEIAQNKRKLEEDAAKLDRSIDIEAMRACIQMQFSDLGPEPEIGVKLMAELPGKKRVARKFAPEDVGEKLFWWIAHEEEMFVNGEPVEFNLLNGVVPVDRNQTLADQNIQRPTLLRVMPL